MVNWSNINPRCTKHICRHIIQQNLNNWQGDTSESLYDLLILTEQRITHMGAKDCHMEFAGYLALVDQWELSLYDHHTGVSYRLHDYEQLKENIMSYIRYLK